MKLTTKGRFAVTAMLDLVMQGRSKPVSLNDISCRQKISLSYLEQLFFRLKKKGLVTSKRGPNGGYYIKKDPSRLSVADIMLAVEEKMDATQCSGLQNCVEDSKCITHDLWTDLNSTIRVYLESIKLNMLVKKKQDASLDKVFLLRKKS